LARFFLVSLFDEYALGLRYIASSLLEAGHDVRLAFLEGLLEFKHTPLDPSDSERVPGILFPVPKKDLDILVEEALEFDPHLVGISVVSNLHGLAAEVSRVFHERLPVPVAWGGVDPTVNPDFAEPHADVICVGEGERAMVELADRLEPRGRSYHSLEGIDRPIRNLRIRKSDGWCTGREGVMEQDLDSFPFPLFDLSKEVSIKNGTRYRGCYPPACRFPHVIPVISFRGCPYKCSYCCHSVLREISSGGKYLRRRSVENFVAEMKYRKQRISGLRMIEIFDDVFTLDQKWIDRFCEEYRKQEVGLPFWCYTYPGLAGESMLAPLHKVGLSSVTFGIQSASQRVLTDVYRRPTKAGSIVETAELLRRLGIYFVVDLIGSNPLETDEDRIETVKALTALPKPYTLHKINPLMFYNRYPIKAQAEAAGVRLRLGPGSTTYYPEPDPRFRAWDAILTLAHYPGVHVSTLRPMWENGALMEHPEPLEELAQAFAEAFYHQGDIYHSKDRRIEMERERADALRREVGRLQTELAQLHGSRLVRSALRLRGLVRKWGRGGDGQ
jgi:anaerobic magnesium-protoporphyrin IX monomethyl ester cyclase